MKKMKKMKKMKNFVSSMLTWYEDLTFRDDTPVYKPLSGKHYRPVISDLQRQNLCRLATYLWSLPKRYRFFNMTRWATSSSSFETIEPTQVPVCGTVACAAGHGPMAGIKPLENEDWPEYNSRCFTEDDALHDFLFSGDWASEDNTPHGAAKRIFYALQHGIPEKFLCADFEEDYYSSEIFAGPFFPRRVKEPVE